MLVFSDVLDRSEATQELAPGIELQFGSLPDPLYGVSHHNAVLDVIGLAAQHRWQGQLGGAGQEQELPRVGEEIATIVVHFAASLMRPGLWAV